VALDGTSYEHGAEDIAADQPPSKPEADSAPGVSSSLSRDNPNLDLIRAAAVLCVFGGHLHYFVTGKETDLSWHFGQIGVLIFFVHTSLVLMMSLDRTRLAGRSLLASFYLKRFFRLYPLSIFCVMIAFVFGVSPESPFFRHWTWLEFASNLTLTTNLFYVTPMVGGLWTLPLEVQMYVVLPFLFRLAKKKSVASLLTYWWIFCIPIAIIQLRISARLNVLGFAPCFAAGVIAWRLSMKRLPRLPGWLWPFAFVASWEVFLLSSQANIMYYRWAFSLLLGLMIPWFKDISYRPLVKSAYVVAKYSYGIYLSHIAIILFSLGLPESPVVRALIFVFLAVGIPVALFHFIEDPMIRLGQLLAQRFFPPGKGTLQPVFGSKQ
jgi:peptidoglycan/LPS O-acetylase OafA/YrhL